MEIIVEVVGLIVGIGVLIMHIFAPHKLGKLEAFQKSYGHIAGRIMHIVFYGLVPLGVGIYCLIQLLLRK